MIFTEEPFTTHLGQKPSLDDPDSLMHYGMPRRSGRYPWGSGKEPYQHSGDFLSRVESLKRDGLTEKEICEEMGIKSSTELRMQIRVAKHERRDVQRMHAQSVLTDCGNNMSEAARRLGYSSESSLRSLLNETTAENKNRAKNTADILAKELEEKGALDVGKAVEYELGVTRGVLDEALFILETRGYPVYTDVFVPQPGKVGQNTTLMVITKPDGPTYKDMVKDTSLVQAVGEYHSTDAGSSYTKLEYPSSVNSDRVAVRYGDQGGTDMDGIIQLRRGVVDLDLGNEHYSQVRILVDGTHYLKGMAVYADDSNFPDGCDIVFNTNKPSTMSKMDVFKPKDTDNPKNPFGAEIKAGGQSKYIDSDGKEQLSAINKIKGEGDWEKQSKTLSSQFVSKQPMEFIKERLDYTYNDKLMELDDIRSIENPTLKKKLLVDFADGLDSAAMHMQASSLPRQTSQVLFPMPFMKDNEVYAPNYRDGEQIALIRYPHGHISEIPILTVNNRNKRAREILPPDVTDAIGITPSTAAQLSGADFDGDSVTAIPLNDKVRIKNQQPFKDMIGFDPKTAYPYREGIKVMPKGSKGREMGMISNLLTDMQLMGAEEDEVVRALKHSMVVIDAPKHKLDYRRSYIENDIASLKKKYQGRYDPETGKPIGGASTLISRRKQDVTLPERKGAPKINPETGENEYRLSGRTYKKKSGEIVEAHTTSKLLKETKDLRTLMSGPNNIGTEKERVYADYGNKLKALANEVRKESLTVGDIEYDKSARLRYDNEVTSLKNKVEEAIKRKPRERRAIAVANSRIKAVMQENADKTESERKKIRKKTTHLEVNNARAEVGSFDRKAKFEVTEKEWEAIQSGAVNKTLLRSVLQYGDEKQIRNYATPKGTNGLSTPRIARIQAMSAKGYTSSEIADMLGVSTSTVHKYLKS